ncbi:MAG: Hpt domain-containing protein [Myxococcota bacterium]
MSLPDEYRDLVAAYVESLEPVAQSLAAWARRLEAEGVGVQEIRELAHKLAGNGASFGFPEITEGAKRVTESARLLREDGGSAAEVVAHARSLINTLRAATV